MARWPWWSAVPLLVLAYAALTGEFALAAVCGVAAVAAALVQHRRQGSGASRGDSLIQLTRREFENLLTEAFRLQGYQIIETATGAAAGGATLTVRKDRQTYIVQSRHWNASRVDASDIKAAHDAMKARSAEGAIVVCAGRFTRDAVALAKSAHLVLIAGPALSALIDKAQAARAANKAPLVTPTAAETTQPMTAIPMSPLCEKCGSGMILRTAKRGRHAGKRFWGCAGYPECRAVRRVA